MGTTHQVVTTWMLAVIVVASVFTALSIVGTIVSTVQRHKRQETKPENSVCVPCPADLSDSEKAAWGGRLRRRGENGEDICCARSREEFPDLLELVLRHQRVNREPVTYEPGNDTSSHVSAHKRLLPSAVYNNLANVANNEYPPKMKDTGDSKIILAGTSWWQPWGEMEHSDNNSLTEHARNVEVLPSGYHILRPGIYYVTSNVHFRTDSNRPCGKHKSQIWRQNVVRSRPNERQKSGVILSSVHSCCEGCTRDRETSYAGGAFYLQAGDHLHVEVSGLGLVSFQRESSYFGVTMMGQSKLIDSN